MTFPSLAAAASTPSRDNIISNNSGGLTASHGLTTMVMVVDRVVEGGSAYMLKVTVKVKVSLYDIWVDCIHVYES